MSTSDKDDISIANGFAFMAIAGVLTTILWSFIPIDSGRMWTGVWLTLWIVTYTIWGKK